MNYKIDTIIRRKNDGEPYMVVNENNRDEYNSNPIKYKLEYLKLKNIYLVNTKKLYIQNVNKFKTIVYVICAYGNPSIAKRIISPSVIQDIKNTGNIGHNNYYFSVKR